MLAVLHERAPTQPVVELMRDAPAFDPRASAYLLAAYAEAFPVGSVFLCVVDPGVGTARMPLIAAAGGHRFVGPDNGLLAVVAGRDPSARAWRIDWRPPRLSPSFHGRDLFAPVAAMLAEGGSPAMTETAVATLVGWDWPPDLAEVIYLDPYGNAVTGLRAASLGGGRRLRSADRVLPRARTFSDMAPGEPFWYENANGLAEIAVNRGSAAALLGLTVGSPVILEADRDEA